MKPFPLFWIPLLPLLGAAFNVLIGRKLSRRSVNLVACGSVLGSLVVSLVAIFYALWPLVWAAAPGSATPRLTQTVYQWMTTADLQIPIGLVCDPLSAVMLVVVTLVGFLIHVYSAGYMAHDPDYARFFAYLNLFTGAMLILVLADNLPLLFVGWEGVGACSYLLIGFWYDKDGTKRLGLANASAGRKAFIVNRIGDFAFLLGMFVLFAATQTLSFEGLAAQPQRLAASYSPLGLGPFSVAGVAALLLFIGAMGKSAQIPLYVWLPDAMAGPTPVSALIHAATMVTAGVYMVARMNFLYLLTPAVMGVVALTGAITALFAASIGFAQNDIKKVLAYSTISQLGFMFIGVGVGAFSAGIFHVFTHAFFKACLFLCAGAVIHALHDEQDIRQMGGLRRLLPVTHWTFLVSTLAIAGIPPLSGFFSKDEILWKAISTQNPALGPSWLPLSVYVLGLAAAFCTAFYMLRLYGLTFLGRPRFPTEQQAHLHAPGPAMQVPLIVLAVGAAIVGPLGLPEIAGSALGVEHINIVHRWLEPVVGHSAIAAEQLGVRTLAPSELAHSHTLELALIVLSILVAAGSSYTAYTLYRSGPSAVVARLTSRIAPFYRLVLNKYWVDELYDRLFVRPLRWLAWALFKGADRALIDRGGVHGTAFVVDFSGRVMRWFQNGNLQHYVTVLFAGLVAAVYWISQPPAKLSVEPSADVRVGQPVALRAGDGTQVPGRKLLYRWDFDGDGRWDEPAQPEQWSERPTATHRFAKPGRYHVHMLVRDARWGTERQHVHVLQVVDPEGADGRPGMSRRGEAH